MSSRIGETEQPLLARIEKTETAFLTEFHKWGSPVEMRQRTRAAVQRVTEVETEALTGRVKKLETSWVVLPRNQSQVAQLRRTGKRGPSCGVDNSRSQLAALSHPVSHRRPVQLNRVKHLHDFLNHCVPILSIGKHHYSNSL